MSKALLLLDFMNDFVDEDGKGSAWGIPAHVKEVGALENTAKVLKKARDAGIKIIYVTVSYEDGYPELADSKAPLHAGVKQTNMIIKGTWGAEIHEKVKPEGEKIINKTRISPFTNPDFVEEIEGLSTLYLAGVATNFVVEATAREAADRNFEVIILQDCCATMGKEMHEFSLQILGNLAQIQTSDEVAF